jgi:hypothetical protein
VEGMEEVRCPDFKDLIIDAYDAARKFYLDK